MTAKHREDPEPAAPPCTISKDEFPHEVNKVLSQRQDNVFRWLPVIVTAIIFTVTNAAMFSYSYGQFSQRIVPIEEHVRADTYERSVHIFVTRNEFEQRVKQRDKEMEFQEGWLKRIEAKIDKILDRNLAVGRSD